MSTCSGLFSTVNNIFKQVRYTLCGQRECPLALSAMNVGKSNRGASDYKKYEFVYADDRFPPDRYGKRHFCNSQYSMDPWYSMIAAMQEFDTGKTMTFCPRSWDDFNGAGSLADALARPEARQPNTLLDGLLPKSSPMSHELFHFVYGLHTTRDRGCI